MEKNLLGLYRVSKKLIKNRKISEAKREGKIDLEFLAFIKGKQRFFTKCGNFLYRVDRKKVSKISIRAL